MSRLIGTARICNVPFKFIEADSDDDAELESCQAFCDLDEAEILIRKDLPRGHYVDAVLHEALHAIWGCSGLENVIAEAAGLKIGSKKLNRLEETVIRVLTPHLVQFLATGQHIIGKQ
jgi:hypothetical protein